VRKILAVLLLFVCSCAGGPVREGTAGLLLVGKGLGTQVSGTASIVGHNRLLTNAHVYEKGMLWEIDGHPVTWGYGLIGETPVGYCDLAVLQAQVPGVPLQVGRLDPSRSVEIHAHDGVKTARVQGTELVGSDPPIRFGDSGSPVVQDGKLVGVLWGMGMHGEGVYVDALVVEEFLR
jgi:hypothetical protein